MPGPTRFHPAYGYKTKGRSNYQNTLKRIMHKRKAKKSLALNALRTVGWSLPDRFLVRLRFTDYITFSQASGAYSEVFYRAIGPYDPRVAAEMSYAIPGVITQPTTLRLWHFINTNRY